MTQRNPLNERNTRKDEVVEGKSRRSAASAKPKSRAASSVTLHDKPKTKKERERERQQKLKEERKLTDERLAEMGPIVDPKYKFYRKVWLVLLIVAIVSTVLSWVLGYYLPNMGKFWTYAILGVAYLTIIVALIIDFKFLRPVRNAQKERAAMPISKNAKKRYEKESQEYYEAKVADEEAKKQERAARRATLNPFKRSEPKAADIEEAEQTAEGVAEAQADTVSKDDAKVTGEASAEEQPARPNVRVQVKGAKTIRIIDDDKKE